MLYLITGEPGASKTLNTIKYICEDESFQNRPIYYHGIKELTLDWNEIDESGVQQWFDLPEGSVILIDEAQYHFKPRRAGSELPKAVLEMSTHRHRGIDIFLITQHPTLIDAGARKFVNRHYHYERPFQTRHPRRIEFQQVANDPRDYHARLEGVTVNVKLDKKYFGVYKSAEIHTHKQRIPKKVWMVGLMILLFIAGLLHFGNRMTSRFQEPDEVNTNVDNEQSMVEKITSPRTLLSGQPKSLSYEDQWKPRTAGLPHTAPIYDKLNEPKVRPMPNCIVWGKSDCVCYTQQATRMDVPFDMCHSIVSRGLFDPARESDSKSEGRKSRREGLPPTDTTEPSKDGYAVLIRRGNRF